MHVVINGDSLELENDTDLASAIASLNLATNRYAVEVNQRLVPKSQHATFVLNDDDRIEIVQAIGGG